jgi:hypothetical protein
MRIVQVHPFYLNLKASEVYAIKHMQIAAKMNVINSTETADVLPLI